MSSSGGYRLASDALLQIFGGACARAKRPEVVSRPRRALAPHRFHQRVVELVEVIAGQLDRLIDHFVRRGAVGIERGEKVVFLVVRQNAHGEHIRFIRIVQWDRTKRKKLRLTIAVQADAW